MEMRWREKDNVWKSVTILPLVSNIKKAENAEKIISNFHMS